MSMNPPSPQCQKLITTLRQTLQPFWHEFAAEHTTNGHIISIPLDSATRPLFLSTLPEPFPQALFLIPDDTFATETAAARAWSDFLSASFPPLILRHSLSEQELDGSIHTDTSTVWHQWLLTHIRRQSYRLLLGTKSFTQPLPDPESYQASCIELTVGRSYSRDDLLESLVAAGYTRHQASLEPGSFRVRGEQITISHPAISGHLSVLLFGNNIEQIVATNGQRSETLPYFLLPPIKFPTDTLPWTDLTFDLQVIPEKLTINSTQPTVITAPTDSPHLTFPLQNVQHSDLTETLSHSFLVFSGSQRRDDYLKQLSADDQQSNSICLHSLATTPFHLTTHNWSLRSEASVYPPQLSTTSPISAARANELIGALESGQPAVHADHGIGLYQGLQTKTVNNISREYLVLQYAAGDSLAVPVEFAHKVSPYVGQTNPPIYRLGGTLWQKTKKKAEVDAVKFAQELLRTGQKRAASDRSPYVIDPTTEHHLDQSFPFTLTSDQERTWQEIIQDLTNPKPMDRLIVGDVGFGKTELALRAARHVVANGKQVAVLAPTTLLVQQHFDTFQKRLPDLKGHIHLLSRFISPKDQKTTREAITTGEAQIAIGTHALLAASTQWQDLGLIIIDEEQRFGVKQKEHFKQLRASVDILSLSATPIPRTLSLALSGLRSLSVISTPPQGRKSVKTIVKKSTDGLLTEAIQRELNRGGQVYVVAPKIRHLASLKEHLQALVPTGKFAVAHGRLPDDQLARIIHDFDTGAINVLVSSSIVENGLDLPHANTMIVWHAPHFGLAELYQLRGRVGRRSTQGYAYFLYNQHKLTSVQRQRLAALTEASRLGSGWELARRDLEIRGAGNLLGAEQSGSVNSVGASLYLDMIREAVDQEHQGDASSPAADVDVQLPFPTLLPADYISEDTDRVRWYGRLSRTKNRDELEKYVQELTDTSGPLPAPAQNLILSLHLAHAAAPLKVTSITSQTVTPSDEDPYHRLILTTTDPKPALAKLNSLGNWQVKGYDLTWDVNQITPNLIETIVTQFE